MLGGIGRRVTAALWAALSALTLVALTLVAPVAAADGGLVVVADTRYVALPDQSRVHVTIQAVATSFEPDTPDAQVYYSGVTFAVPPGATNISAVSGGARLATSIVEETDDYRALEVTFSRGVFFQQTYAYTVSFDLVDAGGAGDRDVRVGRSVVAFPVWAFGTEEETGGSVRVELPAGYQPTVQGSPMSLGDGAGGPVLTAEPEDPFAFFAYVSADRPGAFVDTALEIPMERQSAEVVVRAWEDDVDWGARVGDLLSEGLPVLERMIGVTYRHPGRLNVEEAAVSRLGEYAGIFDRSEAVIRIRYDADAFVALHEAAHLWFNDRLFDERWINEAWAEFYAVAVGEAIGTTGFTWELSDELLDARIPLNDWGAVGREDLAVEDFAYAATYELAGLIAARTDLEALEGVWRAAANREMSYLPDDGSGASDGRPSLSQPGWQRLLDLLEERTGESYADLWAEWVVNGEQQRLLATRASLRSRYEDVRADAGDWELPEVIRAEMGDWQFADAIDSLQQAERILRDRERIEDLAAALELDPSDELQRAFEGAGSLDAAQTAAEVELAALAGLRDATGRLDAEPGPLEALGLIGELSPEALLSEARSAYESGEPGAAIRAAADAVALRDAASAAGRSRVTLAASLLLAVDGLALVASSGRRLQRRPATLPPA